MEQGEPERIRIGQSGIEVRALGVGTWAWGDRLVWGFGRDYGEPDVEQAFHISRAAGLDFFDTAELYGWGKSERILGGLIDNPGREAAPCGMSFGDAKTRRRAIPSGIPKNIGTGVRSAIPSGTLSAVPSGIPKNIGTGVRSAIPSGMRSAIIATKFFPYPWRLGRGSLLRALRSSLHRLRLEQVDLYQVHWPFPPVPIEWWMQAMAEALDQGLTRAVGVSNFSTRQMERAHMELARHGIALASNQVEFHLLDRSAERSGLLRACRDMGVTLIAYSPLAMGLLTGKYGPAHPPPLQRRTRLAGLLPHVTPVLQTLRQIGAEQGGKTPAQVALNWTMCKGTLPIPGAKNAGQAAENAGALGWRLTGEQVARLDEATEKIA